MTTTPTKPYQNQPSMSLYLGKPEVARARAVRLDSIAVSFGLSRSALVAAIADGTLIVVPAPPPHGSQGR